MKNPGQKKTIKVAIGAAGRIDRDAVAISLRANMKHLQDSDAEDEAVVSTAASSQQAIPCPTQFLSAFPGELADIREHVLKWAPSKLAWHFPDIPLPQDNEAVTAKTISMLLTMFMDEGAFAGSKSLGLTVLHRLVPSLMHLQKLGYVAPMRPPHRIRSRGACLDIVDVEQTRWILTTSALLKMKSLSVYSRPVRMFKVPVEVPALDDCTECELISLLQARGWTWMQWVPKPKRTKKTLPIPDIYMRGQPHVWYSTASPLIS